MKIKVLYNAKRTSEDKPNNHAKWIDALKKVLTNKSIDVSSIGANMVGGHMSDEKNSTKVKYIEAITQEKNNLPGDKQIEVEFYADYNEVKEVE